MYTERLFDQYTDECGNFNPPKIHHIYLADMANEPIEPYTEEEIEAMYACNK